MKQTAVEWLQNVLFTEEYMRNNLFEIFEQAKEMEKQQIKDYAIFAVNCDRKQLPLLDFEDYIFLYKI
jgi:tRNA(Ser,Leu) C12 N-acetylase TAN1